VFDTQCRWYNGWRACLECLILSVGGIMISVLVSCVGYSVSVVLWLACLSRVFDTLCCWYNGLRACLECLILSVVGIMVSVLVSSV
jgi:hypothetical protein